MRHDRAWSLAIGLSSYLVLTDVCRCEAEDAWRTHERSSLLPERFFWFRENTRGSESTANTVPTTLWGHLSSSFRKRRSITW